MSSVFDKAIGTPPSETAHYVPRGKQVTYAALDDRLWRMEQAREAARRRASQGQ